MTFFRSVVLCCGIFCFSYSLPAQVMRGWEVGPWAGVSYYLGDLNTDFNFGQPNLAGGIGVRFNWNERLAFRMSANYGKVEAYDSNSKNAFERRRNLDFQSNIFDGTAQFEFNFMPYVHGSYDRNFTPYLFGGISVFTFNPKTEYTGRRPELQGELIDLRPLGTEGQFRGQEYYTVTGALTYGIGFKLDLSYELSLDFNLGVRNTFTDYLDDVSTVYPDRSDLLRARGELAVELFDRSLLVEPRDREGEQRGDANSNDIYLFAGIGINYYFGDVRCPDPSGKARR